MDKDKDWVASNKPAYKPRKRTRKVCDGCQKVYYGARDDQKYCSSVCSSRSEYRRKIGENKNLDIPCSSLGALSELRVCADLLYKGYHVFRSVSPACPCDLVIIYKDKLYRVEVTTAVVTTQGDFRHGKKDRDKEKYDILVFVLKTGEIHYEPGLPK